jgi:predicted  nucleic acid-binding Zn-ribbon protein
MIRKLTVPEYANLMKISPPTVYRRIKAGKIETETIDGILHVVVDESQFKKDEIQQPSELFYSLQTRIEAQQAEIEYLREQLSKAQKELSESRQSHDTIIQQLQQDAAEAQQRSDTIILQLTRLNEQQTKLLEDMRQKDSPPKRGFLKRLLGKKER